MHSAYGEELRAHASWFKNKPKEDILKRHYQVSLKKCTAFFALIYYSIYIIVFDFSNNKFSWKPLKEDYS